MKFQYISQKIKQERGNEHAFHPIENLTPLVLTNQIKVDTAILQFEMFSVQSS